MGDALAGLELLLNAPDKEVSGSMRHASSVQQHAPWERLVLLFLLHLLLFVSLPLTTDSFPFPSFSSPPPPRKQQTVLNLMDDAFACRDGGWTQDRRRSIAQDLSLGSGSDDGQQQVSALFASAVHLIKVTNSKQRQGGKNK